MIKSKYKYSIFKGFTLIFTILGFYSDTLSQTLTSSPYSYFGLGLIEKNGFCENLGAGSSGIAIPSSRNLNQTNPASYAGLDSATFYFHLGMYGKFSKFESNEIKQNDFESNLKYIALGFKISKRWGSSIGLVPFSSRGYYVTSTYPVEGEMAEYKVISSGSGSINRFYFSNSFKVIKNLSIGANVSYLFGSLINDEQISYYDESFDGIINSTTNYFRNLFVDFGLQYSLKSGNNEYYLGLTYNPKQNLKTSFNKTVSQNSDTIYTENSGNDVFTIPNSLGIGLGVSFESKLKLMFDYKTYQWSKSNYNNNSVKLTNSWQINTGAEYVNNTRSGRSYWDYVTFRLGCRYEKSYLTFSKHNVNELAFTTGISLPIKYNRSVINIAYEYGIMGIKSNGLIREAYSKIVLGLSLNDRWFQKTRFY